MRKTAEQIANGVLKSGKVYRATSIQDLAKELAGCSDRGRTSRLNTSLHKFLEDGKLHEIMEGDAVTGYQETHAYEDTLNRVTTSGSPALNTSMRAVA